jgi:hypothetical protein
MFEYGEFKCMADILSHGGLQVSAPARCTIQIITFVNQAVAPIVWSAAEAHPYVFSL